MNPYDYEKIVFVLQQLAGAEATQLETKAEQVGSTSAVLLHSTNMLISQTSLHSICTPITIASPKP